MIFFRYRQVAPAPYSPPLGGSDGCSAVRFTPAVKYGGRENRLSRRETRCIRYHPCRAHHKLKWARKKQSGLGVLYEYLTRSESNKAIVAVKFRCPLMLRRPPKLHKVTPCSTGVDNNPLTIPEHSQRTVSRMPKARRSRLSLTRCAGCAILPLCIFTLPITKQLPRHHCSSFPSLFIQKRPLIASRITISRTNLLCP